MSELPPELADLYAAERAAPPAGPAARLAVRSKLAATVGAAPLGAAGAGATLKVLAVLAIFVAAGAGALVALHRGDANAAAPPTVALTNVAPASLASGPAPLAPTAVAAPATTIVSEAHAPIAVSPQPAPPQQLAPPQQPAPPAQQPVPPLQAETPAQPPPPPETTLVRTAWLALSANDPARALELVRTDEASHPHGELSEERDAIRIVALARLGRLDDARAAASSFFAQYPASLQRQLVERALSAPPT